MKLTPSSERYMREGEKASKHMVHHCTLAELAVELGCSPQLAHYYSLVALGKVVVALREQMKENQR